MSKAYSAVFAAFLTCLLPLLNAQTKGRLPAKASSTSKQAKRSTDPPLSVQQIERLISARIPDEIISGEILSRGIDDDVDRAVVGKVRAAGAGPQTVAVLLKLVPQAELSILTAEGATVILNGQPRVIADHQGQAGIRELETGVYDLRITKPMFRDFSSRVRLNRGINVVEAKLEWSEGFLNVRVAPADATIAISNMKELRGPVQNLPIAIGEQTVTAAAPYRTSVTRRVTIEPGKISTVEISLDRDPVAVERLRSEIEQRATEGNVQAVVTSARLYRSLAGEDQKVLKAVVTVYLVSRLYQELPSAVAELLRGGGSFSFVLSHHHTGLALRSTHPARVTFSGSNLQYIPEGNCNTKEFTISVAKAQLTTRKTLDGYNFLTLSLQNPLEVKKTLTMNFLEDNSGLADAIVDIFVRANRQAAQ